MAINLFLTLLLILSSIFYFIPVEKNKKKLDDKDIPLVIFEKPIMYTISEKNVTRVAKAQNAIRYKDRDEFKNADIILRNASNKKDFELEKLKAIKIIKKDDILTLENKVEYKRDDFMEFRTNEMIYNLKTKIAHNNDSFEGNYNNHKVKGKNLFLDSQKSELNSQDTHFEFDLKNKKGK